MTDRFADTSGWASWLNADDQDHAAACAAVDATLAARRKLVTTGYVLGELTALLIRLRMPKPQQIATLRGIRSDPAVVVVPGGPDLEAEAWALWEARPDKEWSWVDCASFVVMRQRRLTDAITADHHFEQAGFVRLLK